MKHSVSWKFYLSSRQIFFEFVTKDIAQQEFVIITGTLSSVTEIAVRCQFIEFNKNLN
jgi:hypothetical protein